MPDGSDPPCTRRRTLRRIRQDERGYTLVEMLMAIFMLLVILAAVVQLATVVQRSEPELNERAAHIQRARVLMERLGRELRQSYAVRDATATALTFDTWVRRDACGGSAPATPSNAIRCAVTYTCDATTCSRGEGAPGSTPALTEQLAAGLENTTPFAATPAEDPDYVAVTLVIPGERGDDAVTLSDGVNLRNEADLR